MEKPFPEESDSKIQEYREFVLRRECTKDSELRIRLDHGITGLVTESGDLSDLMKKIKFYKIQVARIKFLDELADNFHYFIMCLNALGVKLEDLMRLNMTKLRTRSPNGFDVESAVNKNKEKEREVIEGEVIADGSSIENI